MTGRTADFANRPSGQKKGSFVSTSVRLWPAAVDASLRVVPACAKHAWACINSQLRKRSTYFGAVAAWQRLSSSFDSDERHRTARRSSLLLLNGRISEPLMRTRNSLAAWLPRTAAEVLILGVGALSLLTAASPSPADVQQSGSENDRPSLIMAPDREFAASSYVHKPLAADAPRDSHSDVWVAQLLHQIGAYYGVVSLNIDRYSPPVYVVSGDQPTVRVRAERASDPSWTFEPLQRQWDSVPLPDGFEPALGTDKEAIVYQPSTRQYWEFWGMERSGRKTVDSSGRTVDEWRAGWGGKIDDLATSPGYFPTTREGYKFGATATGLALLGGLMTIAEQREGTINHAIHIALPQTRRSVWAQPAQRTDGRDNDPNAIPEGARFRIPESVDLDQIAMDPYARMVARAVQKYGMIVRDTAGAVVLYAENPLTKGADHPYFGMGGILRCPMGHIESACYADSNNRLRGFPWDKLQAVQARLQE